MMSILLDKKGMYMTFKEWIDNTKVDLKKYYGNVGDENGICIEQNDGSWIFWGKKGIESIPRNYYQ